jgi:protein-S-isoprenylcysteine O-methyltransferase Ste14
MKHFFIAVQFFCVLFLFLSGPIFISSFPFNLIQLFSMFFICWALFERWGNKKHGLYKSFGIYLIKTGPYEFIRHPVYAGILLFVASVVQAEFTFLRLLAFLLFVSLILLCIKRDEKLSLDHFKNQYSEYLKRTKRLIPYLY